MSKDKPRDDYYEPRQHYDKDYHKDYRSKKAATYYVSNTQTQRLWNKYNRNDEVNSQPYCDFHKRQGHHTSQCRHLQEFLFLKYQKGEIKADQYRTDE